MSWLYDVIYMGDMDFGYNGTSEDFMYSDNSDKEEISNSQVMKVVAVVLLVTLL